MSFKRIEQRVHPRPSWRLVLISAWALGAGALLAWDTLEEQEREKWLSVYIGPENFRNEHTALADLALREIGAAPFDADEANGHAELAITDLNASLFRPELRNRDKSFDNADTPLEERLLPPPAHFAGTADYSYTIYDWINKNALCPALPESAEGYADCHAYYPGWLSALNSAHFGRQSARMYRHFHKIALALADRARRLRERFGPELHGGRAAEYLDYVREAELEALVYEGFGQHFLQDRWSSGHMWERFNAPDYEQLADKSLARNVEVGLVSGLLHGAEAVFRQANEWVTVFEPLDPMCSPVVTEPILGFQGYAEPVTWLNSSVSSPQGGVGDYRASNMLAGELVRDGATYDLALDSQVGLMMRVCKAGWVEVIRAFGADEAGLYGVYGVRLQTAGLPEEGIDAPGLMDPFATDEAIDIGFNEGQAWLEDIGTIARIVLTPIVDSSAGLTRSLDNRFGLVRLKYRIWRANRAANSPATSTTLARGGIGDYLGALPGNAYDIADYVEEFDKRAEDDFTGAVFDQLPDTSEDYVSGTGGARPGRDKQAIFGFFNRAHVDYWCERLAEAAGSSSSADLLGSLRGSPDEVERAACEFLADRLYAGTDPRYAGAQRETRRYEAIDADTDPVCAFFEGFPEGYNESLPAYLHPGYVSPDSVGAKSSWGYSAASVANWCAQVPVVNLIEEEDGSLSAEDHVGTFSGSGDARSCRINGFNFGQTPGTVQVQGQALDSADILAWSDASVVFRFPEASFPGGSEYALEITADDGRASVGRFVLAPDADAEPVGVAGLWAMSYRPLVEGRTQDCLNGHSSEYDPGVFYMVLWPDGFWQWGEPDPGFPDSGILCPSEIGSWYADGDRIFIQACPRPADLEAYERWTLDEYDLTYDAEADALFGTRTQWVAWNEEKDQLGWSPGEYEVCASQAVRITNWHLPMEPSWRCHSHCPASRNEAELEGSVDYTGCLTDELITLPENVTCPEDP